VAEQREQRSSSCCTTCGTTTSISCKRAACHSVMPETKLQRHGLSDLQHVPPPPPQHHPTMVPRISLLRSLQRWRSYGNTRKRSSKHSNRMEPCRAHDQMDQHDISLDCWVPQSGLAMRFSVGMAHRSRLCRPLAYSPVNLSALHGSDADGGARSACV
jgi:hypothetical protein